MGATLESEDYSILGWKHFHEALKKYAFPHASQKEEVFCPLSLHFPEPGYPSCKKQWREEEKLCYAASLLSMETKNKARSFYYQMLALSLWKHLSEFSFLCREISWQQSEEWKGDHDFLYYELSSATALHFLNYHMLLPFYNPSWSGIN